MTKAPRKPFPTGQCQAPEPVCTALPQPDRSQYIYLVADDYMQALEYAHAEDMAPATTRYISCPEVLQGVDSPQVIVLGGCKNVSEGIIDALARHKARITYNPTASSSVPSPAPG